MDSQEFATLKNKLCLREYGSVQNTGIKKKKTTVLYLAGLG